MNYYDDQKRLIATSVAELNLYFMSLPGAIAAYEVPITLPCNPLAVIQVRSSGAVPKFIYRGQPVPSNKIYPQILPTDSITLNSLCNGATVANTIPAPDCGTAIFVAFFIATPDCGTPIFVSGYDQLVTITPNSGGGWALYGDIQSSVTDDGVVTLNVSVINSGITTPTSFTSEWILTVSQNGTPITLPITYTSAYHPNMPPSSSLNIASGITGGQVYYTGDETSVSPLGAVIEIFNIQYNINN